MKRYYFIVLTVAVFVIATGIGTALAGGSSDSSGEGSHCYLFFTLPDGKFAQAMVNDSDPDVVLYKVDELIEKYVSDEEGTLDLAVGNIEETLCSPVIYVDSIEAATKALKKRNSKVTLVGFGNF